MRLTALVASAAGAAVLATLLPGEAVAPAASAVATAAPARVSSAVAGVETLGPIPVVPGIGPLAAELPPSVAHMPEGSVANPDYPFLHADELKDDPSVTVEIFDVSAGIDTASGGRIWRGELANGWGRIGTRLKAGHGYAVQALNPEVSEWQVLGTFTVLPASKRSGPSVSSGGMSVSVVTGEMQWAWASESLPAPTDGVGVGLSWAARQAASPGLPPGWQLAANVGSPWARLTEFGATKIAGRFTAEPMGCDSKSSGNAPTAVYLEGWDGSALAFQRNASGLYEQVTGGVRVPGFSNTLALCGGSAREWRFTDIDGQVTRFRDGHAVEVTAQDQPIARLEWSGDRLAAITNASDRTIRFVYAGSGTCPSSSWEGFSAPAVGALCQIRYPGDIVTDIGYVSAGLAAPQIALIKDPGNQGVSLGWDSVGRMVSTRAALVNQAATVDAAAKDVQARVEYDSRGRAAVLKDAPARPGGDFIVNRIQFPVINDSTIRSTDALQAIVRSVGGPFDMGVTYWLDPVTFEAIKTRDNARLTTQSIVDEKTGAIVGSIDSLGRRTTYETDETGALTSQQGPYIVNQSSPSKRGMEQQVSYDTTQVAGRTVEINGVKADVYQGLKFSGDLVEREFWKLRSQDAGLAIRMPVRGRDYSARITGLWQPTSADDEAASKDDRGWDFELSMSAGVRATLIVGSARCVGTPCTITGLASGPKQVTMEVSEAPAAGGWVSVKAAPAGAPVQGIPSTQITPGFRRATRITFNDTYSGSMRTPTVDVSYANPAVEAPTQVSSPGGLVSTLAYEPSNPAADLWGRQVSAVSAGGLTQSMTYWADTGTTPMPSLCGGGNAVMSGQARTVTRTDGARITTYYDIRGRVIAQVLAGDGGRAQTTCLTYFEDGTMRQGEVWDANGALLERSTLEPNLDGDPLTMRTTVVHGPAAPVDPGATVTTTTTVNLHGLPVRYVDETGTTTVTTYTVLDDQATVSVTPPRANAPALVSSYDYRPEDGQITRITINGVVAAEVTYQSGTGRVEDVTYGNGTAAQALTYSPSGQPSNLTASGGGYSFNQSATYTVFGRVSGMVTSQRAPQRFREQRTYTYDDARRMTRVDIASSIDGSAEEGVNYRYDYAATQDSSCGEAGAAYPGAASDMLRTGGSRAGVRYVTCHDEQGRLASTTDPLVSGDATGRTTVTLAHDSRGRVRAISGGARPVTLTWGTDTNLAVVAEGAGADAITTTMSRFGDRIVRKTVTGSQGSSTVQYAYSSSADSSPLAVLNANGSVQSYTVGLPAGATVTVPIGGTATMTLAGLDGSALVTIPMPVFNARSSGPSTAPATVGRAERFGAYGEALVTPSTAAGGSAAPIYGWQAAQRQETLAGTAGITLMGARPYLAALGEFLAPDANFQSASNLYSYTPGDPVNGSDNSGDANEWSWFWQIVSAVTVVASFVVGAMTGGWLIPLGMGFAATAAQMLSAKTQEEPSPGLDVLRQVQFWGQTLATVAYMGYYAVKGLVAGVKWIGRKCGFQWATKSKAAIARPASVASEGARDSVSLSSRGSSQIDELLSLAPVEPAAAVVKLSRMQRFALWVGKANPRSGWWRNADGTAVPGRSYVRSLGKLATKLGVFGGGYGFQKWAEGWQPSAS